MVGIGREPLSFAVGADRLLADLALQRVLQDVVAHPAQQLRQERSYLLLVCYLLLLVILGFLCFHHYLLLYHLF